MIHFGIILVSFAAAYVFVDNVLTLREIKRLYPAFRNESIREFSFTTEDRGLTWKYFGDLIPASSLTDELQNALDDVTVGALPGSRTR